MKTRNFLIMGALISTAFIFNSCYKSKDYNTTANKVSISSTGYSPASLTVMSGSTVTWTNTDNMVHTVTTADGIISSGDIAAGASFSQTFTITGTYNYYDINNKSMMGSITVTKSGGGY